MPPAFVVNLFGGPGAGKSTVAAATFALLKDRGLNVELVTEFAKELCWDKSTLIDDQLFVFAEQARRHRRVRKQVQVIVTDSPLLLSLVYCVGKESKAFEQVVRDEHAATRSLNILLERVKPYQQAGRYQDEFNARILDERIKSMLQAEQVSFLQTPGVPDSANGIAAVAAERL